MGYNDNNWNYNKNVNKNNNDNNHSDDIANSNPYPIGPPHNPYIPIGMSHATDCFMS